MRNPRTAALMLFAASMLTGMTWGGLTEVLPWWVRYPFLLVAPFVAAAAIDGWCRRYAAASLPIWLVELLHVTWGFALREHQKGSLTPTHALRAIEAVPVDIRRAARLGDRGDGVLGRGSEPGA